MPHLNCLKHFARGVIDTLLPEALIISESGNGISVNYRIKALFILSFRNLYIDVFIAFE